MRPFEGVKVLDCTHVLAGPFATYQLAVLGADVVKVENPRGPDQSRESGGGYELADQGMGLAYQTQGSNKRSIALDLKTDGGRAAFHRLATNWADVLVENYRAGALASLGLGYDDLSAANPGLIYASMTGFGQDGPRSSQTSYDHAIQATSGLAESTGTPDSGPIRTNAPVVDYATGTSGAFAISAALLQRERTGRGQRIDLAMLDVALILQAAAITEHLHTGERKSRRGNWHRLSESSVHETADGLVQLAVVNRREHRRFFSEIGMPEEASRDELRERHSRREEKDAAIASLMRTRTAEEWETFLQERHVPAAKVRPLAEALQDPQLSHRGLLHTHERVPGCEGSVTVPVAAFTFEHDGPRVDRPPPTLGQHTDEVLTELGYSMEEVAALRSSGDVV
jgi:crotonobetainyl-CoA:carnitine CoA-transferase CaiB-like acyl-CoA transferase